ncbi:MAG: pentaheme c-type cytochrome TorC [Hyphomicrobiales bacterium]|nr:pentaheme c-type cytochrome TorC [Hyphomicrobiales bacterium]
MLRLWKWFWSPTKKYAWGAVLIVGGIGGIIFWGGFNTFMEYTNRLEFCISCHEMEQAVYREYKESVHYSNASGVRAVCSDCHVPKEWVPKLVRKVKATNELWHKMMGTINTPEKFESKRLELARHVWAEMEANDSHECRNCHSWDAMHWDKQRKKSSEQMQKGMKEGETCISCHKGIAHKLPDMSAGYRAKFEELSAAGPGTVKDGDLLYSLRTKSLFLDRADAKPDGRAEARLLGATEVKVLATDGDWLKVRIDGWQQDGVGQIIYALMGQRIFSVAAGKPAVEKIERHETKVDPDTEQTWHRVSLEAWTSRDLLIADKGALWAYAGEMYNGACGVCHSLRHPDHYLANQWIGTLKAMQRFITLDKEEYRFLQKYLQFHAKDTGGQHAAAKH